MLHHLLDGRLLAMACVMLLSSTGIGPAAETDLTIPSPSPTAASAPSPAAAGTAAPSTAPVGAGPTTAPATGETPSKFISPEDGWLDMSGFLDEAYGFVPLMIPITEPAVGYGAAGVLTFIDNRSGTVEAGFGRPNLTAVGALATSNGTKGLLVGDLRHWFDDQIQTQVGLVRASVNLEFAGLGRNSALNNNPLSYNLDTLGGRVGVRNRLGHTPLWLGLSYSCADTDVSFNALHPPLPAFSGKSRIGGLSPAITYDSRNNFFTPTSGTYVELSTDVFSASLGGDGDFQRVNFTAMHYIPLQPTLTLGLRADAASSFGDTPFYMEPFISLRGVPVMRYQGQQEAQFEAELRWQFWRRFSVVGFAGTGAVWNDHARIDDPRTVITGGVGLRYELARKYGLHMGADVAMGPDGPAFYIQFGSAWLRP